ncbi:MAG: Rrf2 family transcriptional regulator [Hamadaea sp.]|nr:Rrf2 family transcriptional regulator [Hamadaea sp.]
MKLSGGVEWALHCCVVLTTAQAPVPVTRLAELHDVSTSYLAKQLQALSRAGIIHAVQGHSGGYRLTRPATDITVLDVVEAVDGPDSTFVCTEIRQRGPLATAPEDCVRACPVARVMIRADQAWRSSLRATTIADLVADVRRDSGPQALPRVGAWLAGDSS